MKLIPYIYLHLFCIFRNKNFIHKAMYYFLGSSFLWAREDYCCLEADWLWWPSESLIGLDLLSAFPHDGGRSRLSRLTRLTKLSRRPHTFTRPSILEIPTTFVSRVNTWLGHCFSVEHLPGNCLCCSHTVNPPAGQTGLGWNIFSVCLTWDERRFLCSLPGKARSQLSGNKSLDYLTHPQGTQACSLLPHLSQ